MVTVSRQACHVLRLHHISHRGTEWVPQGKGRFISCDSNLSGIVNATQASGLTMDQCGS